MFRDYENCNDNVELLYKNMYKNQTLKKETNKI